jgi:hypothetical protein
MKTCRLLAPKMRRWIPLAVLLVTILSARPLLAANALPDSMTMEDYLALVARAGGSVDHAYVVSEHWYGPGFANRGHTVDVLLAQKANDGKAIGEVITTYAAYGADFCDHWPYRAANTTLGERLELDGVTLMRASFECLIINDNVHEEYVVAMDARRHQVWSLAGDLKTVARLQQVAAALFAALAAIYR